MSEALVRKPDTVVVTLLGDLPLVARGKVRDVYDLGDKLLIVATDRLSAYDVVLPTPIPGKGKVLTQMSRFWFERTRDIVPNHLITCDVSAFPPSLHPFRDQLEGRAMLVKACRRIDFECVARGYITGSLFREYLAVRKSAGARPVTLHGFDFPGNLVDSQKLPEPIFTPATKSNSGHDENISFDQMASTLGKGLASRPPRR